jgi:hypothetical protein
MRNRLLPTLLSKKKYPIILFIPEYISGRSEKIGANDHSGLMIFRGEFISALCLMDFPNIFYKLLTVTINYY